MACKIERPAPRVLFESIKSMFSSNVLGGAPVIPESNEWYVVSNDYAIAEQFFSISEQAWKERDPRYACCDNLIEMAALDGVYPRPALFASGYIQLSGEPGAALPSSVEASIGGQSYINAAPVQFALDELGFATVRMRALEPGLKGNLKANTTTGNLTSPIAGVNSQVTIFGGQFCGGAEEEDCEAFRQRYLNRMRYQPYAGLERIKQKILEWPCVTSVCERTNEICCEDGDVPNYVGGIDCNRPIRLYAMFDDTFPCGAAPESVINEIQEWMFGVVQGVGQGQAPWGMTGKIYPFKGAYLNIDIDGLACTSPATANEIRMRITEYVARLCPSTALRIKDLEAIVSQLMAGTGDYAIYLHSEDPNITITACGDAEPACDYRICLGTLRFTNPGA